MKIIKDNGSLSSHDGSKGRPPKKVRQKLKEKLGWDWDAKELSVVDSGDYNYNYNPNYSMDPDTSLLFLVFGYLVWLYTGDPSFIFA